MQFIKEEWFSYLSLQEEEGVDYAVNVIPSAVSV